MGLDLSRNGSSETMHDEGDQNLALRIVGLVTVVRLTTETDDQSSLHSVIVSTDVTSDHIGLRSARWEHDFSPDLCWVSSSGGRPLPAGFQVLDDFPSTNID